MFGLGPSELIVILVLVILLFGAKRLPEVARGLGQGLKEFKRELKSLDNSNQN
jgi:sec-independent protein translocase protein TatA